MAGTKALKTKTLKDVKAELVAKIKAASSREALAEVLRRETKGADVGNDEEESE